MPKVNETCTEIIFKILPHYREDILAGRKKVDFRCLSDKWSSIAKQVEQVRFVCNGKPDVLVRLTKTEEVPCQALPLIMLNYRDIDFEEAPVHALYFCLVGRAWEERTDATNE